MQPADWGGDPRKPRWGGKREGRKSAKDAVTELVARGERGRQVELSLSYPTCPECEQSIWGPERASRKEIHVLVVGHRVGGSELGVAGPCEASWPYRLAPLAGWFAGARHCVCISHPILL